jgi:uncharacterized protein involved in type VI secretion and phage assembly
MNARVYGVVVGLVIDAHDPDEQGRVKLRFPWLAEEGNESGWAPVARPMAGKERGYWYVPEIDDEALVAFEHGDVNHPTVLGFLHNGVDRPPSGGVDEHVRRLRSVVGHDFELDDRSGKESVRLSSKNGHRLELHDADGYVELHTSRGHKLRMEDQPGSVELVTAGRTSVKLDDVPSQITLTTASGVTVTISDAGGVSVTSLTGGVTVNSLTADVTAATALNLTAPIVNVNAPVATFSGVLMAQTLVASTGVVSPSYTPGAGNIW